MTLCINYFGICIIFSRNLFTILRKSYLWSALQNRALAVEYLRNHARSSGNSNKIGNIIWSVLDLQVKLFILFFCLPVNYLNKKSKKKTIVLSVTSVSSTIPRHLNCYVKIRKELPGPYSIIKIIDLIWKHDVIKIEPNRVQHNSLSWWKTHT